MDEKDAYFAGLLFADGSFERFDNPNWTPRTCLGLIDKGIVEKFATWIGGKVHRRTMTSKNHSDQWCVKVANQNVFNFCDRHGVVSKVQVSLDLAQNLNFWRGFVDGDGSIGVYNQRGKLVIYNNSPVILMQFREYVSPVWDSCSVRPRQRNCYRMGSTSKGSEEIVQELYGGASVYIERKFDIFSEISNL